MNGNIFLKMAMRTLKPVVDEPPNNYFARNDLASILLELLNYRLQNFGFGWKWDIGNRTCLLISVIEQLLHNPIIIQSSLSCNIQMSQLLEQTFLRFVQCTFPHDLLNTLQLPQLPNLWTLYYDLFRAVPELGRAFLLNAIRASKLLGDGHKFPNDGQALQNILLELGWQWPRSELQWFPTSIQQVLYDQQQNEEEYITKQTQKMLEIEQYSSQEMQNLFHLNVDYFAQPRTSSQPPTLFISIFRCLYQFNMPNFQFPQQVKQPHSSAPNFSALCYKILCTLGNRDLHKYTNLLVDWLAYKCG
jgi:hypothetical protein